MQEQQTSGIDQQDEIYTAVTVFSAFYFMFRKNDINVFHSKTKNIDNKRPLNHSRTKHPANSEKSKHYNQNQSLYLLTPEMIDRFST